MTASCLNISGVDVYDALDSTSILANPKSLQDLANQWSDPGSGGGDYYISGQDGTADILFTAGEEAGIGLITPTFTYLTPTDKPGPVTPE